MRLLPFPELAAHPEGIVWTAIGRRYKTTT